MREEKREQKRNRGHVLDVSGLFGLTNLLPLPTCSSPSTSSPRFPSSLSPSLIVYQLPSPPLRTPLPLLCPRSFADVAPGKVCKWVGTLAWAHVRADPPLLMITNRGVAKRLPNGKEPNRLYPLPPPYFFVFPRSDLSPRSPMVLWNKGQRECGIDKENLRERVGRERKKGKPGPFRPSTDNP